MHDQSACTASYLAIVCLDLRLALGRLRARAVRRQMWRFPNDQTVGATV